MIDLTRMDLSNVRETARATRRGNQVRIYANDGYGDYPIHGAIYEDGEWDLTGWTSE